MFGRVTITLAYILVKPCYIIVNIELSYKDYGCSMLTLILCVFSLLLCKCHNNVSYG